MVTCTDDDDEITVDAPLVLGGHDQRWVREAFTAHFTMAAIIKEDYLTEKSMHALVLETFQEREERLRYCIWSRECRGRNNNSHGMQELRAPRILVRGGDELAS
jgi:hypothetical protein